jgi:hypothetical protein
MAVKERVLRQEAASPCGLESSPSPLQQRGRGPAGGAPIHDFGDVAVWPPALHGTPSAPVIQRAADDTNGDGGAAPQPDPATPETPETPQQPADNNQADTAASGLIVEDSVTDPSPEQMGKSDFLAKLRPAVTSAASSAMGDQDPASANAEMDDRLDYYSNQDATVLESDIRQYAPEASNAATAADYIPAVADAVHEAISSGNTPSPATDSDKPRLSGPDLGLVQFKRSEPGPAAGSPQAIQRRLGRGAPLEGGLRSRMESALGYDFSRVRIHTDYGAARLSSSLKARAFTVGEHVAFSSGEYQPGTLIGDALVAHELAHVVQQGGGAAATQTQSLDSGRDALEDEADMSAIGAVASLWGAAKGLLGNLTQNAVPALKSGLRLSRCCPESTCNKKVIHTIDVDIFDFPGRKLDPDKEVAGASRIWRAGAGIQFNAIKHAVSEPDAQQLIGKEPSEKGKAAKDLSLKYSFFPFTLAGDDDEMLALHGMKTSGFMSAFFVPDMHGIVSHSAVDSEPGVKIAYIAGGKGGCPDGFTLAHELGHLLIDPSKSVKGHNFASGLMSTTACDESIDCDECGVAR